MSWNRWHRKPRITPKQDRQSESAAGTTSTAERQPIAMEERRQQGMMRAGRVLGQGARSRSLRQREPDPGFDRHLGVLRLDRRGATG
jgi:hypothetical protein